MICCNKAEVESDLLQQGGGGKAICSNKPNMEKRLGTIQGPLLQNGKRIVDGGDHSVHHLHHVVVR